MNYRKVRRLPRFKTKFYQHRIPIILNGFHCNIFIYVYNVLCSRSPPITLIFHSCYFHIVPFYFHAFLKIKSISEHKQGFLKEDERGLLYRSMGIFLVAPALKKMFPLKVMEFQSSAPQCSITYFLFIIIFFKFEKKLALVTRACNEVILGRLREEYPKIKVSLSQTVSLRPN